MQFGKVCPAFPKLYDYALMKFSVLLGKAISDVCKQFIPSRVFSYYIDKWHKQCLPTQQKGDSSR